MGVFNTALCWRCKKDPKNQKMQVVWEKPLGKIVFFSPTTFIWQLYLLSRYRLLLENKHKQIIIKWVKIFSNSPLWTHSHTHTRAHTRNKLHILANINLQFSYSKYGFKRVQRFILLTPEVFCFIPADLTVVWKRWLLRRQRRVLPPVCVQITPWFAPS